MQLWILLSQDYDQLHSWYDMSDCWYINSCDPTAEDVRRC